MRVTVLVASKHVMDDFGAEMKVMKACQFRLEASCSKVSIQNQLFNIKRRMSFSVNVF